MTFEVELKARINDPQKIEAQAAKLGHFIGEFFKEDVYYCPVGDSRPVPSLRYRLRREGDKAIVTFKHRALTDGIEVNEEIEFAVDDAPAFFRFAHYTGAEPFVVKHKRSRVYQVGRANIELNEVTHLGYFAEIEILVADEAEVLGARAEISHLLTRLGLNQIDLEPGLYIEMLQAAHPVRYRYDPDSDPEWPFVEITLEEEPS